MHGARTHHDILYLTKNIDNITIYYEDVPLDERMIKDLDSFMAEYVDNSIPYRYSLGDIPTTINNEKDDIKILPICFTF